MKSPSAFRLLSVAAAISSAASKPLIPESPAAQHLTSESISNHLDAEATPKNSVSQAADPLLSVPQPKLPRKEPSRDSHRCGGYIAYVETVCGTKRFCQAYDDDRIATDQMYDSSEECLEDREPSSAWVPPRAKPKRPWLPNRDDGKCERKEEACVGTWEYCLDFDARQILESSQEFANSEDCFAAHEPNPRTKKLPWIEDPPEKARFWCDYIEYTDKDCGTQRYCEAFDRKYERPDVRGPYKNSTECFNDHEPGFSPAAKGRKMRYLEVNKEQLPSHCFDGWVDLLPCGTELYCEAFDAGIHTDRKYPNTAECFNAFEPPSPTA